MLTDLLMGLGWLAANQLQTDQADLLSRQPQPVVLQPIQVSSRQLQNQEPGVRVLESAAIERRNPQHPQELFAPLPGVWISRGSGQEHLTAIRSPVLTGAGACGAFLMLENNVPIRPAGFCNVNQLFEVNLAGADSVNVLAGPGLPQHGANALFGVIDVQQPTAVQRPAAQFQFEFGSDDFYRAGLGTSNDTTALGVSFTNSNSFREAEGYQQLFADVSDQRQLGNAQVSTRLNAAYLDQQTAGFITGFEAYLDEAIRTSNPNPEAFRQASAIRLVNHWQWQPEAGQQLNITGFARRSRMQFLQHFLPGQPLETNGQISAGVQSDWQFNWLGGRTSAGLDAEVFDGFLTQFQADPLTTGSPFLQATRPQGAHYDFDVLGYSISQWLRYQFAFANGVEVDAGVRAQWVGYHYSNNLSDGNNRDDGTACGFGGCLYTRPADRNDGFFDLAPSVIISGPLSAQHRWQLRAAQGFRPPQATELYRLQNGQTVADLNSERSSSIAVGLQGQSSSTENLATGSWRYALTGFYQQASDQIFRNADGFNVSDGATRAVGIEWLAELQLNQQWRVQVSGTYADHEYRSDSFAGAGERFIAGNQVDTAPLWQAHLQLDWQPDPNWLLGADLEYLGEYFLDAANTSEYPGHTLLHLNSGWQLNPQWRIQARLRNVFDKRYAERADFAFNSFRYFPGQGRSVFISLLWSR